MRAVWIAVACAAAAGCGKSSSPAPAPPPSSEPSGSPTTAQPTPTPSPSPSPSPTPDRFATVQRLDSDPECDPLVPASVPDPVTIQADPQPSGPGASRACGQALSDGRGFVAAAVVSHLSNGANLLTWQAFRPDGSAGDQMTRTTDDPLFALPEGWQGPQGRQGDVASAVVFTWFSDGTVRTTTSGAPTSGFGERQFYLAPDPGGGSLLVQTGPPDSGSNTCGDARRIGSLGESRTAAPLACQLLTSSSLPVAGVSIAGESLLLERNGRDVIVRWIGVDGDTVREATEAGAASFLSGNRLFPLLDGSLALRVGGSWTRLYLHLADHGDAPPPWLQARHSMTFRFTRGNRGYAFFPPSDQVSSDCSQVVDIVAPDGRNCARITFHETGSPDCKTGFVDQGWDGTVVRQASSGTCTWRFWPAFLAGP
jgi:hypothetical protein